MDCPTPSLFKDGLIEGVVEEFMRATDNCLNSKDFVLPMINYTGSFMEIDEAIELLTIYNIRTMRDLAVNHVENQYKNSLLIFNHEDKYLGYINIKSIDNNLSEIREIVRAMLLDNQIMEENRPSFTFLDGEKKKISKDSEKTERITYICISHEENPESSSYSRIRVKIRNPIIRGSGSEEKKEDKRSNEKLEKNSKESDKDKIKEKKGEEIKEKCEQKEKKKKISLSSESEKKQISIDIYQLNNENPIDNIFIDQSCTLAEVRRKIISDTELKENFYFIGENKMEIKTHQENSMTLNEILQNYDKEICIMVKLLAYKTVDNLKNFTLYSFFIIF